VKLRIPVLVYLAGICISGAQDPPAEPLVAKDFAAAGLEFVRVLGDLSFKHANSLTHIEPLPDGRLLTSAEDGAARVWNLNSGEQLQRFSHGDDDVWNAIALPGGKQVATAGQKVRIWDIATGKMLREFEHEERAFRLAAIPGGKLLASGHDDSVILIRNWETGELVRQIAYAKDEVYTLIAPSKNRLIASGDDGIIQLWNLDSGDEIEKVELEDKPRVTTLTLSPNRERFVVNAGKKLLCFDCKDLAKRWELALKGDATIAAWSPDGKFVVTCKDDSLIKINARSGKSTWRRALPYGDHRAVAYSLDGTQIFSGGDQMVYRFAADDGEQQFPAPEEAYLRGDTVGAALSADGETAFTAGSDRHLHMLDISSGKISKSSDLGLEIDYLAISPEGDQIAVASDDGPVKTLSTETGKVLKKFDVGNFSDFAFGAGGTVVVENGNAITRWRDGKKLGILPAEGSGFDALGVDDRGEFAAAVADDAGGIKLWDLKTGALNRSILSEMKSPDEVYLFPAAKAIVVTDGKELHAWFRPTANALLGRDAEIAKRVADLASDSFPEREIAKEALIALGPGVISPLEALNPSDPEVRLQIAQVSRLLRKKLAGAIALVANLDKSITGFAAHPDGVHWVAVTGSGHTTQLHLGRADRAASSFEVIAKISSPHSASSARFSKDGKWLLTGNRTASLGLYRFRKK
jgi:WD40 repeat protein